MNLKHAGVVGLAICLLTTSCPVISSAENKEVPAEEIIVIYAGEASNIAPGEIVDIQEAPPIEEPESVEYVTDEELAQMEADQKEYDRAAAKAAENREQAKREEEARKPKLKSLGVFNLTAYCTCKICCGKNSPEVTGRPSKTRSGTHPVQGRTVAVDPNVIPLGTHIFINGHEYVAEDTGSWVDGEDVDIFFDSHKEALIFGRQKAEVFVYQ